MQLVVASSRPTASQRKWLDHIGVKAHYVVEGKSPFNQPWIAYPSVIIVDSKATVTNMWFSLTSSDREEILQGVRLAHFDSSAGLQEDTYAKEILLEELPHFRTDNDQSVIIDPRRREQFSIGQHHKDATNLPFDEWAVRIPNELVGKNTVFVDCSVIPVTQIDFCRKWGYDLIHYYSFGDVYILKP